MDVRVMLQAVVFALVFTMLAKHQVWGETDCHHEKESVMLKCKNSIKISGPYVLPRPGDRCCTTVQASDMVCICHILTEHDEKTVDPKRLVKVADHCGKPVPVGRDCGSKFVIPFIFLKKILALLSNHQDRSLIINYFEPCHLCKLVNKTSLTIFFSQLGLLNIHQHR